MEIGPVCAVRPIGAVKPSPKDSDISGVFAIELSGREADDRYSPRHAKAARGLEEDEAGEDLSAQGETAEGAGATPAEPAGDRGIDIYA